MPEQSDSHPTESQPDHQIDDAFEVADDYEDERDEEAVSSTATRNVVAAPTRPTRTKTHISYDKLPRFEGRATPRQLRQLNALRIDLMSKRTRRGGPRITNNTLIRVALDGLLASRRNLKGDDEDELRQSFLKLLEDGRAAATAQQAQVNDSEQ